MQPQNLLLLWMWWLGSSEYSPEFHMFLKFKPLYLLLLLLPWKLKNMYIFVHNEYASFITQCPPKIPINYSKNISMNTFFVLTVAHLFCYWKLNLIFYEWFWCFRIYLWISFMCLYNMLVMQVMIFHTLQTLNYFFLTI